MAMVTVWMEVQHVIATLDSLETSVMVRSLHGIILALIVKGGWGTNTEHVVEKWANSISYNYL